MTEAPDELANLAPSDEEIRNGIEGRRLRAELRSRLFGAAAPAVEIGPYRVKRKLGAGGIGSVYEAEHGESGDVFAVKVLQDCSPAAEARLRREGRGMAKVSHPNVVAVHDIGRSDDGLYIAMDYVAGTTLRGWLKQGRTPEQVIELIGACAEGLAAAHALGLVHRDVKPDNILVDEAGRPRVTDFGLAKSLPGSIVDESTAFDERLTATGATVGTIGYMAPEQLLARPITPATDQFALAVTAWEALFGSMPFRGSTIDGIALAILEGRVEEAPATSVPHVLDALRRGLAPEPEDRFATTIDFAQALRTRAPTKRKRSWWPF